MSTSKVTINFECLQDIRFHIYILHLCLPFSSITFYLRLLSYFLLLQFSSTIHVNIFMQLVEAELTVDQPPAVAFTAFADVLHRATGKAALCAIGPGGTLTFELN